MVLTAHIAPSISPEEAIKDHRPWRTAHTIIPGMAAMANVGFTLNQAKATPAALSRPF